MGFSRFSKAASEWGDKVRLKSASLKRGLSRPAGKPGEDGGTGSGAESENGNHQLPVGVVEGRQTSEEEQDALLQSVPEGYYEEPASFDALEHELRHLPTDFTTEALEGVAEERTAVLEVVSEKLSQHVIRNYDKFVEGVNEVIQVEQDLQVAHVTAKKSREHLALALREVSANIAIARDTKRKQALVALLEVLLKLQQANNLQRALKEAQENGEFAEALWLCAQCTRAMDELGEELGVVQELTVTINRLYKDTSQRLEAALAAVCGDFRPGHYTKVLEGWMFLGNPGALGAEVKAAFVGTINASVAKVVRGVLLTRPGMEERAGVAGTLQELVRLLPSDLFRTCLARALMVIFDILVSHFHMVRWHEAALEQHQQSLEGLREAQSLLLSRLGSKDAAADETSGAMGCTPLEQLAIEVEQSPAAAAAVTPAMAAVLADDSATAGSAGLSIRPPPSAPPEASGPPSPGEVATVTGRAVMQLQRGTASELEEVEAKASDEEEWGAVLRAVHAGLLAGRQLIWEEAARRIGILLSSPAAFEGEHFLQVMDWTQRALAVGESFSGLECTSLRTLLQRQSANFFRAFHHSNLEALNSMLDKEMWRPLPAVLPSLAASLTSHSSSRSSSAAHSSSDEGGLPPSSFADFETFVTRGNPWRKQIGSPKKRQQQHLGFSGASVGDSGQAAAQHLEVDEYGVPLSAPPSPSGRNTRPPSQQESEQSEAASSLLQQASEADELYGESIDEDTQQVRAASSISAGPPNGSSGRDADGQGAVTNSSWRMARWMGNYCSLMRSLPAAAVSIFTGLAELYDLYLLHVFIAFGDVNLGELLAQQQHQHQQHGGGGSESMSPRLRSTLVRVASESIGKYLALFSHPADAAAGSNGVGTGGGSKLVRALASGAASRDSSSSSSGAAAGAHSAAALVAMKEKLRDQGQQYFARRSVQPAAGVSAASAPQPPPSPGTASAAAAAAAAAAGAAGAPAGEISAVVNPGNLYGLLERSVAAESLLAVANRLTAVRPELAALLPPGDAQAALDSFYSRTVGAAADLRDHVLGAGARLLLPIRWVAERVAAGSYVLSEPPTSHAPWVNELETHLQLFRDRLAQVPGLPAGTVEQLWVHAQVYVAECMLEGIVSVKKCSLEGRAAMAVDLQGVAHALAQRVPRDVPLNLRLVDDYIKGFYIPQTELTAWAARHPQYSHAQVLALTGCIAESSGLKKKDKAALLAQVEAGLRGVGRLA